MLSNIRSDHRRRFVLSLIAIALLMIPVGLAASAWAEKRALAVAKTGAEATARNRAEQATSELQKFQLLPVVLTEYPDVTAVLTDPDPAALARLNRKLQLLAERTGAAVIYLIGADARTIAASNWNSPSSFIGHYYDFRPYFREAMRTGAAELFALGTTTRRPGLYIARSVSADGRRAGVIVVKVEFDQLEAGWAREAGATFATDRHGVVIITSRPEWRFRTSRPISPEVAAHMRRTLQFGTRPIERLPLDVGNGLTREGDDRFVMASAPIPLQGARLHFLRPLDPLLAAANADVRAAILALFAALVLILVLATRARENRLVDAATRKALEAEVALQTAELRETNARLLSESRERERADARFRQAREELAQANRLGLIGQIIAGVVHEVNQPVAAIRSYTDNAMTMLDRGQQAEARANLGIVGELTQRIGAITGELRAFARKRVPPVGAVRLGPVIDGVLMLIGDRLRASGAALERSGNETLEVVADRVRLEQILINLIQNALEAGAGRILIAIEVGRKVQLVVADDGPGIDPELADTLFTPFVTGREEGVGLGLAIARDIARAFGGELDLVPSPLGGAAFRLRLKRA